MPRLPASYGVWMGVIQGPDYYKAKYAVDEVAYIDDMASVLAAAGAPCVHLLAGTNTDRCALACCIWSTSVLPSFRGRIYVSLLCFVPGVRAYAPPPCQLRRVDGRNPGAKLLQGQIRS
jgi:hypothetical protein